MSPRFALSLFAAFGFPGDAEQSPDAMLGPAEVCFHYVRFRIEDGESIELVGAGVHGADAEVYRDGRLFLRVREVENAIQEDEAGILRGQFEDLKIYDVSHAEETAYGLSRPMEHPDGSERIVAWIRGPALDGRNEDAAIYGRFRSITNSSSCDINIRYGLSAVLGE